MFEIHRDRDLTEPVFDTLNKDCNGLMNGLKGSIRSCEMEIIELENSSIVRKSSESNNFGVTKRSF